jgi:hypothetical protein
MDTGEMVKQIRAEIARLQNALNALEGGDGVSIPNSKNVGITAGGRKIQALHRLRHSKIRLKRSPKDPKLQAEVRECEAALAEADAALTAERQNRRRG